VRLGGVSAWASPAQAAVNAAPAAPSKDLRLMAAMFFSPVKRLC
jgi:hypothetical protein